MRFTVEGEWSDYNELSALIESACTADTFVVAANTDNWPLTELATELQRVAFVVAGVGIPVAVDTPSAELISVAASAHTAAVAVVAPAAAAEVAVA